MSVSNASVRRRLDDLTEDRHFLELDLGDTMTSGVYKGLKLDSGKWFLMLAPLKSKIVERIPVGCINKIKKVADYNLFG